LGAPNRTHQFIPFPVPDPVSYIRRSVAQITRWEYWENWGNFSALEVHFVLKRALGFYMINFYFPATLIVLLSFLVFWLPREATADRLGLGR
jgi:hypothetical protein